ncbi:iron uptake transporter deferrochelatase/peroxidase subunit [Varibaculum sp.]|uniref:iron uptake transporter deferrochelatase/peroxidase subunit n=1 Tax=Varibaculum sp. TaxID=1895474 RepID=UPI0025DB6586|nr:iron uptake transporter deferrochelatase/peroxidase subunit [Varibaculum sp.]
MNKHSDNERSEGAAPGAAPSGDNPAVDDKGVKISRRHALLGGGIATLAGLGLGTGAGYAFGKSAGKTAGQEASDVMKISYPFRGKHQSGITTPQQQQMMMAAYDLITDNRELVIQLLKDWSLASEKMMNGNPVNDPKQSKLAPPDDTGEAYDLGPGALTITIGFGESFFIKDGKDRFGIAQRMPKPLKGGIPRMAAEKLDPDQCYGDIVVQACSEDPMISMHAIHNLSRLAFGTASVRWTQLGYGRTSSTSTGQKTPRNLFGFKDGTSNVKGEEAEAELNEHLWIQPEDSGGKYFAGGSYLCTRKIKQMMEVWDELVLQEQEDTIGRDKLHGAPQSGGHEFTPPDFKKKDQDGKLMIAEDSHVAVVHPDNNGGRRMLRRGYNYMEGTDSLGRLEGGLMFIAYVRNPQTNFIPILRKMSGDAMTEYLQHISTSMWVIPPGMGENEDYIGQKLFES